MPRQVQFEGVTHTFPDDASDAEVSSALESHSAAPAVPKRSFLGALGEAMVWPNTGATRELPGLTADAISGGIKRAYKTITNVSQPIRNAFPSLNKLPSVPMDVESHNPSETQGAAIEQAAEFALPGAVIGPGMRAVKAVTAGAKYAPAINAGAQALMEGVGAGTVGAAQTGSLKEGAKTGAMAGGVSAGLSAAGAVLPSAERVYLSALKPKKPIGIQSPQKVLEAQQKVARTGIRENIPVSKGGLEKAEGLTDQLGQETADVLAKRSQELGPVIGPGQVASRINPTARPFGTQVNPEADVRALESSRAQYLDKHTPAPPPENPPSNLYGPDNRPLPQPPPAPPPKPQPYTLAEAQAEKQDTYGQLRKKYGELSSADTEGQKALARGLKEEIQTHAPEVGPLNKRTGEIIGLEEQLANFVKRHNNRDLLDLKAAVLGASMAGAGGAGHGYQEGGLTGALKEGIPAALIGAAMGNPNIKSRLAIALDRASKLAPAVQSIAPKAAAAAVTPQMAKGGVVAPSARSASRIGQSFRQRGGLDAIHHANMPDIADAIRAHNRHAKAKAAPSLDVNTHMADFLKRPSQKTLLIGANDPPDTVTREGDGSAEVHRLAPGKGGKWAMTPMDMKRSGRLQAGLYLMNHGKPPSDGLPGRVNPIQERVA